MITLPTAEAELSASTIACRECLGQRNVWMDLFRNVECLDIKLNLYGDNRAANMLARGQCHLRKVRHLSLGWLFVKEATQSNEVSIHWIGTEEHLPRLPRGEEGLSEDGLSRREGSSEPTRIRTPSPLRHEVLMGPTTNSIR